MKIYKNSYNPIYLSFINLLKTFKCIVIGHKLSDVADSGYNHCERCLAHEYWDTTDYGNNKWNNSALFIKVFIYLIVFV